MIFAGDIKNEGQKAKIENLGEKLSGAGSLLKRFTPAGKKYDSVIEVLTVHSAPRQETTIFDFPPVFRPWDDSDGWDYWKIFVDDQSYHEGHGHAYENYGVDPQKGCAVVVRPDQYVSFVTEVDDYEGLDRFFSGFMVEQKQHNESIGQVPQAQANGAGANGTIDEGKKEGIAMKAGDEAATGTGGN